jgi:hypothetical protein
MEVEARPIVRAVDSSGQSLDADFFGSLMSALSDQTDDKEAQTKRDEANQQALIYTASVNEANRAGVFKVDVNEGATVVSRIVAQSASSVLRAVLDSSNAMISDNRERFVSVRNGRFALVISKV